MKLLIVRGNAFGETAKRFVDCRRPWRFILSARYRVIVAPFEEIPVDAGTPDLQVE
jgi:hypothetical protein